MKTSEQNKQEIVNYLTKTSNHTFAKPKATFKYGDYKTPGYYEYDYENISYFKIIKDEENFMILENGKIKKLEIDHYLKYYEGNAKCVIKHILFLNKGMKSIRNSKFIKTQIEEILDSLKVKA